MYSTIIDCRICHSTNLLCAVSLGEQAITSRFPMYGDYSTPKTPVDLYMCQECGLLQLYQTTISSELYEYEYGYRSGISNTMRNHLKSYQEEITKVVCNLNDGDLVLDIGSNDATMLHYYSNALRRLGIDPTGKQFRQYYDDDIKLVENYFTKENFMSSEYGNLKCKIVSSISMFYDLPDPVQFAKDIYDVLDDNGIWTCEQSYVISMLKQNAFDTICHEHLEYYALHQIKEIADRANLKIIDVKFNDCNGGSFRIYFAKRESLMYDENIELINKILKDECEFGIKNIDLYVKFMKKCNNEIKKLCDFIDCINSNNKEVWLYGASTKGNCLLQYANITQQKIKYAVERNLSKVGKMTLTGIEIVSEETMRKNPPAFLLVLPWHFHDEIIEREKEYLNNGGQLIFPLPEIEIVGSKESVLITGCDGHIAHYVREKMASYNLYGIGHSQPNYQKGITKFYIDMNDSNILEHILSIIKPKIIIHLAGISSSIRAFNNPIETLKTNGLVTAQLCDIIHRNKWSIKLFNASSSEIYKGHNNYTVEEDDTYMHHLHPYSIGKIMGHTMIDFYRKTYNLPFSNGIIFTTESPLKSKDFLLNKVANHAREWKKNKSQNLNDNLLPLKLGNLDSYRNMLHASDVANAISIIIKQNFGDTYLICNDHSVKVYDLVVALYTKCDINLIKKDNVLYDTANNLPMVIIGDNLKEIDANVINIQGVQSKLRNLGWNVEISIDHLLDDIVGG